MKRTPPDLADTRPTPTWAILVIAAAGLCVSWLAMLGLFALL